MAIRLAPALTDASPGLAMSATREVAIRYLISGMVQGVGFRFFAEKVASELKLRGYVKNLSDGRVEVYAVGDERRLERLKVELAKGPRGARVTQIEQSEQAVNSRYKTFLIESMW